MSTSAPRRRAALRFVGALSLAAVLTACRSEPTSPTPSEIPSASEPSEVPATPMPDPAVHATHAGSHVWFEGTPAQALARAKTEGKPSFVYWGAAWCPPCNELAADVFEHPRFPELMRDVVPVYLDGDTEEAQSWGEQLGLSAYPTVLLLNPEREELLRLNGALTITELETALRAALVRGHGFIEAVRRLEEGRVQPDDFHVLAHAAWELLPDTLWPQTRRLTALRQAATQCPTARVQERAQLAAHTLGLALMGRGTHALEPQIQAIRAEAQRYLDAIFVDPTAWRAARTFITMRATDVLQWLYGDMPRAPPAPGTTPSSSSPPAVETAHATAPAAPAMADEATLRQRWLEAAEALGKDENASRETRLWSVRPTLDIARREQPQGALSEPLRDRVEKAVQAAVLAAESRSERQAIVSGASYLLRHAGSPHRARALLIAESRRDATPWYYYTLLSALEQELGRMDEAHRWSAEARKSASGRATRLQWMANDIALNAERSGADQRAYLLALVDQYYTLATQLDDGFSGRNRSRAEQVARALAPHKQDRDVITMLARHRPRCSTLPEERRAFCERHFDALR
ncbi:thioredoxin family protein [Chondromyces crocatus]|uniref:Thioredoxin domain-containing protein n=1 Tax=Chondromyces crocatus TaxID=52 RepID=A0A0K1EN92_CHOCO|nr:thioredoxin family protein [Chondromyces crocatus]AKT42092.1 uncharacterized protein CMC5_063150 [Chondromyces crocatus]